MSIPLERLYIGGKIIREAWRIDTLEGQTILNQLRLTGVKLPKGNIEILADADTMQHGYNGRVISVVYRERPEGVGGAKYSTPFRNNSNFILFTTLKIPVTINAETNLPAAGPIRYKVYLDDFNTAASPFPENSAQMYHSSILTTDADCENVLERDYYCRFNDLASLQNFAKKINLPAPINDKALFNKKSTVGLTTAADGTPIRLKYYRHNFNE